MSVKHMIKDIDELKVFIKTFDADFDNTVNTLTEQEIDAINKHNKIYIVEEVNNNIVTFNISGKLVDVNKLLFTKSIYSNILQQTYSKYSDNPSELKNIIIDFDYTHFQICLDILRKKRDSPILHSGDNIIEYYLPKKSEPDVCYGHLQMFFKEELDRVLKDFSIKYREMNSGYVRRLCIKTFINNNFISESITKQFEDKALTNYFAKDRYDILTLNSKVAFFVNPKEEITFNFKVNIAVSEIHMKPFTSDPDVWYPNDGAGSKIFINDKDKWELVGKVPGDYGTDIDKVYVVKFEKEENFKQIKIVAGLFGFSIGYLNFS